MTEPASFPGGLYVVATPIGNMQDVTLRALEVLAKADAVYAEDTRSAKRLCDRHGVTLKRVIRYDDHSDERARDDILDFLSNPGHSAALVSDAGTPLIADPGFKLVREAKKRGVKIHAVPGASALTAGLSVSGLPTDRFMFVGFPPPKKEARRSALQDLAQIKATLIFYESPRRLPDFLRDAADILGDRDACLLRELTKIYEESTLLPLSELSALVAERDKIYGECAVAIAPPDPASRKDALAENAREMLERLLKNNSVKDACALVKEATGLNGKALYAMALDIKDSNA